MEEDSLDLRGSRLRPEPTDKPLHRVPRYGCFLNELENIDDMIDERIRQLEGVTARARQRQRHARNSTETVPAPNEAMVDVGERGILSKNNNMCTVGTSESGCKRDSSHLVAKALEATSEVKKAVKEGGSFYDCNICLDVARDPVLTCCGHLFCWPCFYQVADIDSISKECPVCKGEVSESTVIPIYGDGDGNRVSETESGLKIPSRPKARRVESVRQQRVTQGLSTAIQHNHHPTDAAANINDALPNASSSQLTDVSGSVRVLSVRPSSGISLPVVPPSFSSASLRRRMLRNSDSEGRDTRESRRRRLN